MKFLSSLPVILLLHLPNAWADCKSDCQNEHQSEVKSCKTLQDDPDEADELRICFDDAKSEYEAWVNECED